MENESCIFPAGSLSVTARSHIQRSSVASQTIALLFLYICLFVSVCCICMYLAHTSRTVFAVRSVVRRRTVAAIIAGKETSTRLLVMTRRWITCIERYKLLHTRVYNTVGSSMSTHVTIICWSNSNLVKRRFTFQCVVQHQANLMLKQEIL